FYHLGERVGLDRMARLAEELGFGAATGIGLPGEVPGFIPSQEYYKKQGGFRIGYALNTAIGQGSTKVTVLQMALAYAALANGGDLWVPQLVDRIETPSGRVVQKFEPRLRRHIVLDAGNLERVKSARGDVVNTQQGSACRGYQMIGQLRKLREHFDWPLFLFTLTVSALGLVNLYSATPVAPRGLYQQQLAWYAIGAVVFVGAAAIDYRVYERFAPLV